MRTFNKWWKFAAVVTVLLAISIIGIHKTVWIPGQACEQMSNMEDTKNELTKFVKLFDLMGFGPGPDNDEGILALRDTAFLETEEFAECLGGRHTVQYTIYKVVKKVNPFS
ncbi:hypothetical protein [Psychrobacillus sp. FSL H8-0510]|uniref:hypothetical protein n=1 Tax=Psychrobacillus sp. FSL H8-0510 TaxID=2921394 RepID=UPI0030FB912C